jgi:hypothetical protein
VVNTIEGIINNRAAEGWELNQIAGISVTEQPGCIASIFAAKASSINYNLMVFKKN